MGSWILLVGADRGQLDALAGSLRIHGFEVLPVANAAEALRTTRKFECAVFLDAERADSALSLAGWLLAEGRVGSVVFGNPNARTTFPQERATNLGRVLPPGSPLVTFVAAVAATSRPRRMTPVRFLDSTHRSAASSAQGLAHDRSNSVTTLTFEEDIVQWQREFAPRARRDPCA